jgi:hypothetical protein
MHDILNFPHRDKTDSLKTCASCGDVFVPRRPWQTFCSSGCRLDAFRRRAAGTSETYEMDRPTRAPEINAVASSPIAKTPVKPHFPNAFQRGVRTPRHVIETEVFGGRTWRQVVSSDGVVCEVGTLRKRTLVEGGAS